ncbi:hypothetical protein P153DRAFT_381401 [Dothidotthia symphoricarpi CBS 119687]|uniref:Uncharacterized protein n=1 Tax=Dothidotthia symphoricarpi CBS 119687 TaxID=1392245 RepID=A0A6A6AQZ1_9PLEO|nr:uncharacterized protein P153DRAFT_381401 [Dothidotthia symphoricarpi CBS 119687]KAF2134220.1 hypothetical protein P153DRAFT_381401 [Dothidotthia symphoricarpi CBS 119687]
MFVDGSVAVVSVRIECSLVSEGARQLSDRAFQQALVPALFAAAALLPSPTAFGLAKASTPPRLRPCSSSTFKLSLLDQLLTFSTTSRPRRLPSSKKELERAFFLSAANQTLESPNPQLPHRTLSEVLPLVEEESGRPRPQPSLGFAPFKPP